MSLAPWAGAAWLVLVIPSLAAAQTIDVETPPVTLGATGIQASSSDGNHSVHLWFRGQFRYTYPFDDAPTTEEGFEGGMVSSFDVRRLRAKIGGNAYASWLQYYVEHDLASNRLLDYRFTISRIEWLQLRVGQWKVNYNRERADSSGKQQFVERSIVNREFTVDRQLGANVAGHLRPGRFGDSWYTAGVFNGNGRNASNDDGSMMWFGRYQWNVLSRDLLNGQGDPEYHAEPAASVAVATLRNKSRFTRFSSAGGGQLDGFEEPPAGQRERYRLEQYLLETALKYRGFSWQQELHWKQVEDTVDGTRTDLRGFYAQGGYFPWRQTEGPPRPLEVAARYAWVDPDTTREDDMRTELTFGVNWFFAGHDNKITVDVSRLTIDRPEGTLGDIRVRTQWDVSF